MPTATRHMLETMTDRELLDAALAKWGARPLNLFAELIGVEPATLRRWRSGESGLTRRRRRWLVNYLTPQSTTEVA